MMYIAGVNKYGKVIGIIDVDNPSDEQEELIIERVISDGKVTIVDKHWFDATNFVTTESEIQGVDPMDIDYSKFTGFHPAVELPDEMFSSSQWIKDGAERPE